MTLYGSQALKIFIILQCVKDLRIWSDYIHCSMFHFITKIESIYWLFIYQEEI